MTLDWMVVGAGPAGIAAVGKLLDQGVSPRSIGWMDPHFQVGDLGKKWHQVSSNTQVELFSRFLFDCKAFNYQKRPQPFPLDHLNPEDTCLLEYIVKPLEWVTNHLKKTVQSIEAVALALQLKNNQWEIKTERESLFAKNVILAMGSEEKTLPLTGPETIPLSTALHKKNLEKAVSCDDTVGVFGSSHSAVLILANLEELKVKKIINFYRSPHQYAVFLKDWTLFDNTGLKGFAANWAKKHLDGVLPNNLSRILTSDHTFSEAFSLCNKVIYAVGFERRKIPVLEQFEKMDYNDKTGIIAPGLFGFGIAFPQAQFDPLMNLEHRVGLWKFMDYLNTILPIWLSYRNT
jgi:hypothetical protein